MTYLATYISKNTAALQSTAKLEHFRHSKLEHFRHFRYFGNSSNFFYNSAWETQILLRASEPLEGLGTLSKGLQFCWRACNFGAGPAILSYGLQFCWALMSPYGFQPQVDIYMRASMGTNSIWGRVVARLPSRPGTVRLYAITLPIPKGPKNYRSLL